MMCLPAWAVVVLYLNSGSQIPFDSMGACKAAQARYHEAVGNFHVSFCFEVKRG